MDEHNRERALSDVLGFTLTIGIILIAAITAYTMGVGELTEVQEFERQQDAARSMEGTASTFAEIQRGDALRRAVEFDVGDGVLSVEDSSIRIAVENEDGSWATPNRTYETGALSITNDGSVASYESGLVAHRSRDVALPRRGPPLVCGDVATLTVVEVRSTTSHSGGSVVVDATRDADASGLNRSETNTDRVVVDVSGSVNRDAWERHLEATDDWTQVGSGEYACSAETVHVRRVVLDLYVVS